MIGMSMQPIMLQLINIVLTSVGTSCLSMGDVKSMVPTPLHFQELYPCQPATMIVRTFNILYHLSLHFWQNRPRGGRGTMHNPTRNLQVSKQMH